MDVRAASELFLELNWSNIEPCLKFKSNLFLVMQVATFQPNNSCADMNVSGVAEEIKLN